MTDIGLESWVFDAIEDRTKRRVHCVTGGLGSGKTNGAVTWKIQRSIENAACAMSWMVAPTYGKCQDILIPEFRKVSSEIYGLVEHEDFKIVQGQPIRIEFRHLPGFGDTKHIIYMHSGARADLMVGTNISDYLITEAAFMKREAFEKCENRTRDPKATCLQGMLECTAEWVDWFVELADFEGIDEAQNKRRFRLHTLDNNYIDALSYAASVKRTYAYDPVKQQCYIDGKFRPFVHGNAFWEFFDSRNVKPGELSPHLPVLFCWDFNYAPLAWVAMQRQPITKYGQRLFRFHALEESSGQSKGIADACAEFIAKVPPERFRGQKIEIYGDASGYARTCLADSCGYDQVLQILRKYYPNVSVCASRHAPLIRDRLQRHNALLLYEMYVVDSRCRNLIRAHTQTNLKKGTWEIEKPQGEDWTHWAEAAGYALFQLTKAEDLENPSLQRVLGTNAI